MSDVNTAKFSIGAGGDVANHHQQRFRNYLENQRTSNDVAGTAFMFEYFDTQLRPHLSLAQSHEMLNHFSYFFWLRRENIIRQAVSWHVAVTSGIWHSSNRGKKPRNVAYDYDEIAWKVAFIEGMDARYQSWFRWRGIKPMMIWYHEVVNDPENVLRRMFYHLELPLPKVIPVKSTLKKLDDIRKDQYVERFQHDLADRTAV